MIEGLRTLPHHGRLEADLCIVGGGAANIALAHALRDSGLSIVLAESGREGVAPPAEDLNRAEIAGHAFTGATEGRARRLGGATTLWAGRSLPLDPIDFEPCSWVPHSGWPIPHAEVAANWPRAERLLRLDGMRYDDLA